MIDAKIEREAIVAYLRSAKYRSDHPWSSDLDKIASEIEKEAHSHKRGFFEYFPFEDATYRVQIEKCEKQGGRNQITYLVVTCLILASTSSVPVNVRRNILFRLEEASGESNPMGWEQALTLASAALGKPTTQFDPPELHGKVLALQTKVRPTKTRNKFLMFLWWPCEE